jgi:hypothetical protein
VLARATPATRFSFARLRFASDEEVFAVEVAASSTEPRTAPFRRRRVASVEAPRAANARRASKTADGRAIGEAGVDPLATRGLSEAIVSGSNVAAFTSIVIAVTSHVTGSGNEVAGFTSIVAQVTIEAAASGNEVAAFTSIAIAVTGHVTGSGNEVAAFTSIAIAVTSHVTGSGSEVAGFTSLVTGVTSHVTGSGSEVAGFTPLVTGVTSEAIASSSHEESEASLRNAVDR